MGLDVYFIRKPIHRHATKSFTDIAANLHASTNKDLTTAIEDLHYYTDENHIDFEACLADIIMTYLRHNSNAYRSNVDGEEVAYFRKLWWIVNYFNYRDEDYGKDVEITKSQIEDLVTMSNKLILMVEKHFIDKGFEIDMSPLNYKGYTIRCGGDRSNYLTFKNGLVTDSLIDEADEICSEALDSNDSFLFYKVCEIYIQFSKVLEDTNFDEDKIYMNADW